MRVKFSSKTTRDLSVIVKLVQKHRSCFHIFQWLPKQTFYTGCSNQRVIVKDILLLTKSCRTEFVVFWDLDSPANQSIAHKIPCQYDSLALNSIMCIRLNIDCDYLLLFYPTHVFIGVYFPGIIISRSKLHVEHRLLFKVKTTTRMTRMHWLVFFHEKWNAFQRLYEKSRFSANRRERHTL